MSRELTATVLRIKPWAPFLQQTVSYNRKPRWIPVAKKRIYYIPKRPEVPEDEKVELKRITDNYRTQMRAVRRFYHEQMLKEKQSQLDTSSEQYLQKETEDFEMCLKINDEWNEKIKKEREERRERELERMQERALSLMEKKDRELQLQIEKANELVRREKEASKTFIDAANLEAAIDHALANPTDYNFSIDMNGNRHYGREANSSFAKKEEISN